MRKYRAKRDIEIDTLIKTLHAIERKLEKTNKRIDELAKVLSIRMGQTQTEQFGVFRAKTEQLHERTEQSLGVSTRRRRGLSGASELSNIRGRHREILALLINNGFHTYRQIAERLGISQSRARAYIAELKNVYGVPLKSVRDPEGYKVGIDVRFVERILAFR